MRTASALVTGAAGGLGTAIAERLLASGHTVHLLDRQATVVELAERLNAGHPGRAAGYIVDLEQEEQIIAVTERLDDVDVLVNNAGIHPKQYGLPIPIAQLTSSAWNQMIAINLTAAFLLSRELLPQMISRRWGRVVNITSRAGRTVSPQASACYAATKAGLIGFSRNLAAEAAPHQITVNCVAPGPIRTSLTDGSSPERQELVRQLVPLGRYGLPQEVAHLTDFLISDEAAFVTGAVLDINGGSYMP